MFTSVCLHSLANRKGSSWVQPMHLTYGSEDGHVVPGGVTGDPESRVETLSRLDGLIVRRL